MNNQELLEQIEKINKELDFYKSVISKAQSTITSMEMSIDIAKDSVVLLEKQLKTLLDGAENGI